MSKSNGTKVVDVDALIKRAKKTAADSEATRQQEAVDDSLRQENESLKAELKKREKAAKIVCDDPKSADHVETVLAKLGDLLFLPNGDLRDLDSLRQQILGVIHSTNGTTPMPSTPPTFPTVPGPPASSDDEGESKPKLRKRIAAKASEFWNPTQPSDS